MQKEFYEKFKSHGYKRNHNRKGYVFKRVGDIEFWARLVVSTLNEGEWYPEFGISTESPYGKDVYPVGFIMYTNTIYLGDLYLDSKGALSDAWKDGEWNEMERGIDSIILPWLEKYTDLIELANHYRHRIEHKIHYIPQPQDEAHKNSLSSAGQEILGLMSPPPEKSDQVGRFWEYLYSIYKSAGDSVNEKECALRYAEYTAENNDLENKFYKDLKTKVEYIYATYS